VLESLEAEDQIVSHEMEAGQSECLVAVVARNVTTEVDQNVFPVEEAQHALLEVVVGQCALWEDQRGFLEVGHCEQLEAVAQCSEVDRSVCSVAVVLNVVGAH